MSKHRGIYLSCAILVLVETVQSFVLLTANVKDIKKIASNFVSDALADKIAEFVVKATEQISDPNEDSGKNKVNTDVSRSREHESGVDRGRDEKLRNSDNYKDKYNKDDRDKHYKKESKDSFFKKDYKKDSFTKDHLKHDDFVKEKIHYKDFDNNEEKPNSRDWSKDNKDVSGDRFDHEQKKWHKEIIEIDSNEHENTLFGIKNKLGSLKSEENTRGPTRFSTTEREYWKKKDDARGKNKLSSEESRFKFDDNDERDTRRPEKESNIFQYYNKLSSSRPKYTTDADKSRNDEDSFQNREQKYSKTEGTYPRYESKAFKNRQKDRSDERLDRDRKVKRDRFKTVFNSAESRDKKYFKDDKDTTRYRSADVTTKKEKTDFDQYDNKNYPKAHFIATSGNLMLPRVFEHKKAENKDKDGATEVAWWEKEMPKPTKTLSWSV